jgi:hypothetical protein
MVPARNDPLPFYPLLVLLAGCLLAAAPHGPRLPWWVTMLATAMLGWRAWAQWRNEILPRRWLLLLLVIVGGGPSHPPHRVRPRCGRHAAVLFLR